jgi:hypothetical protein
MKDQQERGLANGYVAGLIAVQRERADRSVLGPVCIVSGPLRDKGQPANLLLPRVWIVIWMLFFARLRMSVATRRRSRPPATFCFSSVLFVLLNSLAARRLLLLRLGSSET